MRSWIFYEKTRRLMRIPARSSPPASTPPPTGTAPVLVSSNYAQVDALGGGLPLVLTGTDLAGVTAIDYGGTPAVPSATTSTTVTFTPPAHASGPVNITVTSPGGTSNPLAIEVWKPEDDPACKVAFDCVTHAFDGTEWLDRSASYKFVAGPYGAGSAMPTATGQGAPQWIGDDTQTELILHDLIGNVKNYYDFLDQLSGSGTGTPGSMCSVFAAANTGAMPGLGLYNSPSTFGNVVYGTNGHVAGTDTATGLIPQVAAFVWNNNAASEVNVRVDAPTPGTALSLVSRWDAQVAGSLEICLNGATSGAGFASTALNDGHYQPYLGAPITLATNVSQVQTLEGTIFATALLNDKASDTFVAKFHNWARQRIGVP